MPELTERELTYRIQGWLEIRHTDDVIPPKSLEMMAQWLDDLLLFYRDSPLLTMKEILNATSAYWHNQQHRQCIIECISRFLDASFQHDAAAKPFSDSRVLQPAKIAAAFMTEKTDIPFNEQEKRIAYRIMGYLELTGFTELSSQHVAAILSWFTEKVVGNSPFLKTLKRFLGLINDIPVSGELRAKILQKYLASFFIRNIDPFYPGDPQVLSAIHGGQT